MTTQPPVSREAEVRPSRGGPFVALVFLLLAASIALFIVAGVERQPLLCIPAGLSILGSGLTAIGFFIVNPNDARVLVFFGSYRGTAKHYGFFWVNPFTIRRRISLKAHNLNGDRLKVNDKAGNPIEIAAVIVWQVRDTFAAMFEVEHYDEYVRIQSESAVRHLASEYHYDGEDGETTLRGSTDKVSETLRVELQERLRRAGVDVVEARLSHLAYAPEIAHAMLQRQQAAAVIAARSRIVEGAVGMVEMALQSLAKSRIVQLDEERKAAMVSNLLVVLCGERTTPVVNAGTLYQ